MIKASAVLIVMWSAGYLGAELGARHSSWHMLLSCRFVVAALLLVGFCMVRRLRIGRRGLMQQIGLGIVLQGAYLGAISAAVTAGVSPGITALICSLQPLVVAACAAPILGERIGATEWFGLVVGIGGVVLVVGGKMNTPGVPWWAYLLCVAGMLALVAGTLAQRQHLDAGTMVVALAIQCTVGAVIFWTVNVIAGQVVPPASISFGWSVLWVVAFATFGGWGAYMWVNREAGPVHVSTLLLLVPPTTMLIAWPMFGDAIGRWELVGIAVSVLGVAIKLRGARGKDGTLRKTPARNTEVRGPELIQTGRE